MLVLRNNGDDFTMIPYLIFTKSNLMKYYEKYTFHIKNYSIKLQLSLPIMLLKHCKKYSFTIKMQV